MAQQVKFYSTSASDYAAQVAANSVNGGGVYFVDGGELYKGTQRFGANKVWTTKPSENAGVIGGDMYISGGVAEVFNGSTWVGIANANKWTVASFGGEGSYITGISQSADGTVTATAAAFPALDTGDNAGEVKLGSDSAKVNGWDTLVASVSTNASNIASVSTALGSLSTTVASLSTRVGTLETKVSGIEGIVDVADGGTVTASSGVFTDLTVTSTATFSATTVSASTLTVGGSTVNQIAQAEIASVTANTITADGTSLPTESAVAQYVTTAVSNLAGAMHFKGTATITKSGTSITVSNFSETFTAAAGDVVVDTANNLEAVYTGSAWELLGSNSVYALDAYAPGTETVTAGTTTLGGAVHAIAGAVDTLTTSFGNLGTAASKNYADSLTSTGTSLPTESAVATYVSEQISALNLGDAATYSVTTTITDSSNDLPTASTVHEAIVDAASSAETAAEGYADSLVEALDASVTSSENNSIQVGVTQVDGKVTGVTADLVWLSANGTVLA